MEMRKQTFPIFIEADGHRVGTGLRAPATEQPVMVALRLRDRGWDPYKVSFDSVSGAWIALVFDKKHQKVHEDAS